MRRLHYIGELLDCLFEGYDFTLSSELNDLLVERITVVLRRTRHVSRLILLLHALSDGLIVLQWIIFTTHLFDCLVPVSQLFVFDVLKQTGQDDQVLVHLLAHGLLVYDEEDVILDCLEIIGLQVPILLELSEAIKVINLTAKHEDECLHLADELVG